MNQTGVASFPLFAKSIIGVFATCVSTATLGGNIVVLMAFFVESALRIPSNYFIASLAVTDMLIGLFSMNLFIMYQLLGYWPLGQTLCDIWLSLDFSACLTSQYTVFLITVDRYCSVKIPVSYRNWRTLLKVRLMICVSWLFPAGLFSPVIMGWKQLTAEPPRGEWKCDVSFTYYPIFNTTLIIGYFWTTLLVMCSLYVGIYRVARRLQKKTMRVSEKIAELFNQDLSQSEGEENAKDDEELAISSLKHTSDSCSPGLVALSECAGKRAPSDDAVVLTTRHTAEEEEGFQDSSIRTDDESRCSPVKTSDERKILSNLYSPQTVLSDQEYDNLPSISEQDEPPALTYVPEVESELPAAALTSSQLRCLDNYTRKESLFANHCTYDRTFHDTCAIATKQRRYSRHIDNEKYTSNSEAENWIEPIIAKYVPSPEVPMPADKESPKKASRIPKRSESPVWVENTQSRKISREACYCAECFQLLDSSSSEVQLVRHMEYRPFPRRFFGDLSFSPSKIDNFSELSSSEQRDSLDRTQTAQLDYLCAYHASIFHSNGLVYLSDYTDTSSSYSDRAPWYRRLWFRAVYHVRVCKLRVVQCTQRELYHAWCVGCCAQLQHHERALVNNLHNTMQKLRPKRVKNRDSSQPASKRKSVSNLKTGKKRAASMRTSWGHIRNLSSLESHNRRHARKALRTISFILGAFIMCWTPYHIIMMIKGFCDDLATQSSCVSTHLYNLSYWLCYMNSPINPFCYALSNALFRRTFFRILKGDFQRR